MLDTVQPAAGSAAHPSPDPFTAVRHRPQFSGRAGEYFGIWFINLLLSIQTLGLYSAWAKVRSELYFYANTRLAGASFEYLADPVTILEGRLIAYAVVIALGLASRFAPALYPVMFLAGALLMPMVLALRFRARNSAWRGLRFHFDRSAGSGYGPFLGWPLLTMLSFGMLYPMTVARQHQYVMGGHRFGRTRFSYRENLTAYYKPFLWVIGGSLVAIVVLGGMSVAIAEVAKAKPNGVVGLGVLLFMVLFYVGWFVAGVFLRTRYANLLWNCSALGPHRFESTLRARDMAWLHSSNGVAVLLTLGLAAVGNGAACTLSGAALPPDCGRRPGRVRGR